MRTQRLAILLTALAALPLLSCGAEGKPKGYPLQVLIIRHAEKPAEEGPVELSPAGKERAAALPKLFDPARPTALPRPDFIFATKNTKKSHRPLETVTPLAEKLGLTVNTDFANEQTAELAAELVGNEKYFGKTVLICWHQGTMPKLARELKAGDAAPANFPGEVFDRVWRIAYDRQGNPTFADLPQRLMPGDRKR